MEKVLEKLNYFTNQDISTFTKVQNANVYANRYVKGGKIIRLKRGIYVTKERIDNIEKHHHLDLYISYVATNILITPSYLSTEYVLFKNAIITENVHTMSAITTKKTNQIKNIFGKFVYKNIHEQLFWGYKTIQKFGFLYFEAYPEKALLDRLWLKKDLILSLDYFRELRLNLENIDFVLLAKFVKRYNKAKITTSFILLKQLLG